MVHCTDLSDEQVCAGFWRKKSIFWEGVHFDYAFPPFITLIVDFVLSRVCITTTETKINVVTNLSVIMLLFCISSLLYKAGQYISVPFKNVIRINLHQNCGDWECVDGFYHCLDGRKCIPGILVCDGISGDCSDGSDELNCEQWKCVQNR